MEQLIQSSDLFVMQVEMDVYTALKKVHEKRIYFLTPRYTYCSIRRISKSSLSHRLSAVDVSAAQSVLGRSNQAASG